MTQKGATMTSQILQEMAGKIWDLLPQYSTLKRPKFSPGWLNRFKLRHGIHPRMRHGEGEEILNTVVEAFGERRRAQEVGQQEAIEAIQLLQRYEEQQEDGNRDVLRQLAQMEMTIRGRMAKGKQQSQITAYCA
jgi:cytochrome c-type biogenesis protein CcmH/NrfF